MWEALGMFLSGVVGGWLGRKSGDAKQRKVADWSELAKKAAWAVVDDLEIVGASHAEALEFFESVARDALRSLGLTGKAADPFVRLAAQLALTEFVRLENERAAGRLPMHFRRLGDAAAAAERAVDAARARGEAAGRAAYADGIIETTIVTEADGTRPGSPAVEPGPPKGLPRSPPSGA